MTQEKARLLVGLGNPGKNYENTRHNIGFMVVDRIADTFSIAFNKKKFAVFFCRGRINGNEIIFAKPMAFMNRSGPPIQKLASYFNILCEDMIVIHDDIDLAYNRLKIKSKGGHGGHNGIRSLIDTFGTGDFSRIRMGVGRPDVQNGVVGHVLGRFSKEENRNLDQLLSRARDAAVTVICDGVEVGMNRFN